tara:strand:- start:660 stop:1103 length:444 start_codon:yes stop_codon:yes gene_type:complete
MIKVTTEGKRFPEYDTFIDECIVALFPYNADYDINIRFQKFADKTGTHAGFCEGNSSDSEIIIGTHWKYEEDNDTVAYEPHEIASNLAHELTHAKQFCKKQINMVNHVWKHASETIDCVDLDYAETPWEIEAYAYEEILTDLLWENV